MPHRKPAPKPCAFDASIHWHETDGPLRSPCATYASGVGTTVAHIGHKATARQNVDHGPFFGDVPHMAVFNGSFYKQPISIVIGYSLQK